MDPEIVAPRPPIMVNHPCCAIMVQRHSESGSANLVTLFPETNDPCMTSLPTGLAQSEAHALFIIGPDEYGVIHGGARFRLFWFRAEQNLEGS